MKTVTQPFKSTVNVPVAASQTATGVVYSVDNDAAPNMVSVLVNNTFPAIDGFAWPASIKTTFSEAPAVFVAPATGNSYYTNRTTLKGGTEVIVDLASRQVISVDNGWSTLAPYNYQTDYQNIRHNGATGPGGWVQPPPIDLTQLANNPNPTTAPSLASGYSYASITAALTPFAPASGSYSVKIPFGITNITSTSPWLGEILVYAVPYTSNNTTAGVWQKGVGIVQAITANNTGIYAAVGGGLNSGTQYDIYISMMDLGSVETPAIRIATTQPNPWYIGVGNLKTGAAGVNPTFASTVATPTITNTSNTSGWDAKIVFTPDSNGFSSNGWLQFLELVASPAGQNNWAPKGILVPQTSGAYTGYLAPLWFGTNFDLGFRYVDFGGFRSNVSPLTGNGVALANVTAGGMSIAGVLNSSGNIIATEFPTQLVLQTSGSYTGYYAEVSNSLKDTHGYTLVSGQWFWMEWYALSTGTQGWGPAVYDGSNNYYQLDFFSGSGALYKQGGVTVSGIASANATSGVLHRFRLGLMWLNGTKYRIQGSIDGVQVVDTIDASSSLSQTVYPGFANDNAGTVYFRDYDFYNSSSAQDAPANPAIVLGTNSQPTLSGTPTLGAVSRGGVAGTFDQTFTFATTDTSATPWLQAVRTYAKAFNATKASTLADLPSLSFLGELVPSGSGSYTTVGELASGTAWDLYVVEVDCQNFLSAPRWLGITTSANPQIIGVGNQASGAPGTTPALTSIGAPSALGVANATDDVTITFTADSNGLLGNNWLAEIQLVTGAHGASTTNSSLWQQAGALSPQMSSSYSGVWARCGANNVYDFGVRWVDYAGGYSNVYVVASNYTVPNLVIGNSASAGMPSGIKSAGPSVSGASFQSAVTGSGTISQALTINVSDYSGTVPDWLDSVYIIGRDHATQLILGSPNRLAPIASASYATIISIPAASNYDVGIYYVDKTGQSSAVTWPAALSNQNAPTINPTNVTGSGTVNLLVDPGMQNGIVFDHASLVGQNYPCSTKGSPNWTYSTLDGTVTAVIQTGDSTKKATDCNSFVSRAATSRTTAANSSPVQLLPNQPYLAGARVDVSYAGGGSGGSATILLIAASDVANYSSPTIYAQKVVSGGSANADYFCSNYTPTSSVSVVVRLLFTNVGGYAVMDAPRLYATAATSMPYANGSLPAQLPITSTPPDVQTGVNLQKGPQSSNLLQNPGFEVAPTAGSGDIAAGWFIQANSNPSILSAIYESNGSLERNGLADVVLRANGSVTVPASTSYYIAMTNRSPQSVRVGEVYSAYGWLDGASSVATPAGITISAAYFVRLTFADGSITDYPAPSIAMPNGAVFTQAIVPQFTVAANGAGSQPASLSTWVTVTISNSTGSSIALPTGILSDTRCDDFFLSRLLGSGDMRGGSPTDNGDFMDKNDPGGDGTRVRHTRHSQAVTSTMSSTADGNGNFTHLGKVSDGGGFGRVVSTSLTSGSPDLRNAGMLGAAPRKNLIVNGNNSQGTGSVSPGTYGWTSVYQSGTIISSGAYAGNATMLVASPNGAGRYQTIPVSPARIYSFIALVYSDTGGQGQVWIGSTAVSGSAYNASPGALVGQENLTNSYYSQNNGSVNGNTGAVTSGGWQLLSGTFTIPSNVYSAAVLLRNMGTGGNAYFGAVMVFEGNRAQDYIDHEPNAGGINMDRHTSDGTNFRRVSAAGSGANILENGSFTLAANATNEPGRFAHLWTAAGDGIITGWAASRESPTYISTGGTGGRINLSGVFTIANSTQSAMTATPDRKYACQPGETFATSGTVRVDLGTALPAGATLYCRVTVNFFDVNGASISGAVQVGQAYTSVVGASEVPFTQNVVAPANAAFLNLTANSLFVNTTGSSYTSGAGFASDCRFTNLSVKRAVNFDNDVVESASPTYRRVASTNVDPSTRRPLVNFADTHSGQLQFGNLTPVVSGALNANMNIQGAVPYLTQGVGTTTRWTSGNPAVYFPSRVIVFRNDGSYTYVAAGTWTPCGATNAGTNGSTYSTTGTVYIPWLTTTTRAVGPGSAPGTCYGYNGSANEFCFVSYNDPNFANIMKDSRTQILCNVDSSGSVYTLSMPSTNSSHMAALQGVFDSTGASTGTTAYNVKGSSILPTPTDFQMTWNFPSTGANFTYWIGGSGTSGANVTFYLPDGSIFYAPPVGTSASPIQQSGFSNGATIYALVYWSRSLAQWSVNFQTNVYGPSQVSAAYRDGLVALIATYTSSAVLSGTVGSGGGGTVKGGGGRYAA